VSREDEAMDRLLRTALTDDAADAVPGPSEPFRRRVRGALPAARRRRRSGMRRLALAVLVAVLALAIATGIAVATGVLDQRIVEVPSDVFMEHFRQQHHGSGEKGSLAPDQPASLAEAERQAGFRARTLNGVSGARLTGAAWSAVTYRDGLREPAIDLQYRVGSVTVSITEIRDPNPHAPFEIPATGLPTMRVETIAGAQYLFITDDRGYVRDIQLKTADGIVISVNFFGPAYPGTTGPGGVDRQLATDLVGHLG
jgi:hypothetical protein